MSWWEKLTISPSNFGGYNGNLIGGDLGEFVVVYSDFLAQTQRIHGCLLYLPTLNG